MILKNKDFIFLIKLAEYLDLNFQAIFKNVEHDFPSQILNDKKMVKKYKRFQA